MDRVLPMSDRPATQSAVEPISLIGSSTRQLIRYFRSNDCTLWRVVFFAPFTEILHRYRPWILIRKWPSVDIFPVTWRVPNLRHSSSQWGFTYWLSPQFIRNWPASRCKITKFAPLISLRFDQLPVTWRHRYIVIPTQRHWFSYQMCSPFGDISNGYAGLYAWRHVNRPDYWKKRSPKNHVRLPIWLTSGHVTSTKPTPFVFPMGVYWYDLTSVQPNMADLPLFTCQNSLAWTGWPEQFVSSKSVILHR
jgi:hypothetical protein